MNFVCAFLPEATPLIDELGLKKAHSSSFTLYQKREHRLVVSGLGPEKIAHAVSFLHQLDSTTLSTLAQYRNCRTWKRCDWQCPPRGKMYGQPKPKNLFIHPNSSLPHYLKPFSKPSSNLSTEYKNGICL